MSKVPSFPSGIVKSACTEQINMYKVHQTQFGFASAAVNNREVIPLRTSLSVDVVLHVEFVSGQGGYRISEDHQQITTLECAAEGEPIGFLGIPSEYFLACQSLINGLIFGLKFLFAKIKEEATHNFFLSDLIYFTVVQSSIYFYSMLQQPHYLQVLFQLGFVVLFLFFLLFFTSDKMAVVGINKRFSLHICKCKARPIEFVTLIYKFQAKLRLLSQVILARREYGVGLKNLSGFGVWYIFVDFVEGLGVGKGIGGDGIGQYFLGGQLIFGLKFYLVSVIGCDLWFEVHDQQIYSLKFIIEVVMAQYEQMNCKLAYLLSIFRMFNSIHKNTVRYIIVSASHCPFQRYFSRYFRLFDCQLSILIFQISNYSYSQIDKLIIINQDIDKYISKMIFMLLLFYLACIAVQQQPCEQGQKYTNFGKGNTPNGCGGSWWQVSMGKAILAYDQLLTPCCNQHDTCFGQCDPDNSLRHKFDDCNSRFKGCNQQKCKTLSNLFSRTRCSVSASSMQLAVEDFGWNYFLKDQSGTCKCSSVS